MLDWGIPKTNEVHQLLLFCNFTTFKLSVTWLRYLELSTTPISNNPYYCWWGWGGRNPQPCQKELQTTLETCAFDNSLSRSKIRVFWLAVRGGGSYELWDTPYILYSWCYAWGLLIGLLLQDLWLLIIHYLLNH